MFKPAPMHADALNTVLDQTIAWGRALETVRK